MVEFSLSPPGVILPLMPDMMTTTMSLTVPDDAQLVIASLSGNRDAFGMIVTRYQSLICSLAYSATGSLGASEDLAQETFITAWKHLRQLRERHKLRAWLCGIARNRINSTLRREGREPARIAEPLENIPESASAELLPDDQTISKEEEAILWRSLERIPENYRETLVLFYREHQSVENVAAALDLSEDAVKQRLSRGRKLLAEEVAAFVEGALARTNPGKAFTLGVLAALPAVLTTSAKAAAIGAVAAKGSVVAKSAAAFGMFNFIAAPVLGFVGPWLQYRVVLAAAKTAEERRLIRSYYSRLFALMLGFGIALVVVIVLSGKLVESHPWLFVCALTGLVAGYAAAAIRLGIWANAIFRKMLQEQDAAAHTPGRPIWEYRSRLELFRLPLVHFCFHRTATGRAPVKAWIAAGNFAIGGLFAFGGMAVAPLSFGGVAFGLLPFGGLAFGLFPIGGFALGGWAFGGLALGWEAFGGCALAWHAAMGGLAVARDFALGGAAQATQANNEAASQFIKGDFFFQRMVVLSRYVGWLNLLWLLPILSWWRIVAKRKAAS